MFCFIFLKYTISLILHLIYYGTNEALNLDITNNDICV